MLILGLGDEAVIEQASPSTKRDMAQCTGRSEVPCRLAAPQGAALLCVAP
jgi:hypothetical protein